MTTELTHKFRKVVKRVEFFPFEHSANLLAVCFADSIQFLVYTEGNQLRKEDETSLPNRQQNNNKLVLMLEVPFEQKIDCFNWSPKTFISSLKPMLSFAVSDNTQTISFCSCNLNSSVQEQSQTELSNVLKNLKSNKLVLDVDCIYNISFDNQNGELVAITADNYCFLYDSNTNKIKARFLLLSPGINICWHTDEKSKLMVGEKSGLIRVISLELMKTVYTIMCGNDMVKLPLLSFDWCQFNPEIIVASTATDIFLWNTSRSCLPERVVESYDKIKSLKLSKFKENLIGFIDGYDACSKLTIMNYITSQIIYQSNNMKLMNSFSFNSILPIVAISNEQSVTINKIVG